MPANFFSPRRLALVCVMLFAACLGYAIYRFRKRDNVRPSTIAWGIAFEAMLCAVLLSLVTGFYQSDDLIAPSATSTIITICGMLALTRDGLFARFEHRVLDRVPEGYAQGAQLAINLLLIYLASHLAFYTIELPFCPSIEALGKEAIHYEISFLFILMTCLYFLFQQRIAGVVAIQATSFVFGTAELLVTRMRGSVFTPGDLLSIGTAMEVADGFTVYIDEWVVNSFCYLAIGLVVTSLVIPPLKRDPKAAADSRRAVMRVVANLALAALLAGGFVGKAVDCEKWCDTSYWRPNWSFQNYGCLNSFVVLVQRNRIPVPDSYTKASATKTESQLAESYDASDEASSHAEAAEQFAAVKPTVITIMNESFADLSIYDALRDAGYAGPEFVNTLPDAISRGSVATSVLGGGTANSEFEFLTGDSMAFIGSGKYPYTLYDLSSAPSLAKQFADLGYETTAIHPNIGSNYSRNVVYQQLGFDSFLTIDDFEGAEYFHNGVSDRATYDTILDIVRGSDSPQFIFDLTMANHMGYDVGNIPAARLTDYTLDAFDDNYNAQMNEYLSCIQASDEDLEYLVEELRQLDKPVLLVFFGDHQPSVSSWICDAYEGGKSALDQEVEKYQTPYLIWANYDVAGIEQESSVRDTSLNFLGALAAEAIGAPLTSYQKAELMVALDMPSVSITGYQDADGVWHDTDSDADAETTTPAQDAYALMQTLQYLEFGSKV